MEIKKYIIICSFFFPCFFSSRIEIQLPETENPQTWILGNAAATAVAAAAVNAAVNGGAMDRPCTTFAFRRQDAKIAWPRQING
jgi:MFS-type transporter involved in bile tolerance (Atg22 family)